MDADRIYYVPVLRVRLGGNGSGLQYTITNASREGKT